MKKLLLAHLFLLLFTMNSHADPTIHEINILTPSVERFGKFEATIDLTAAFTNPYDYDEIAVTAAFTSPSGEVVNVDGFFMVDYNLNISNGNLSPAGEEGFRLRFSPKEIGTWSFFINVSDTTGTVTSDAFTFQCTAISSPANHGFVRSGLSNYLSFDNGDQYIPIGENIAWQNTNPYLNYTEWLNGLIENGGNFFRLWHAHWGLGVEWRDNDWSNFDGLRRYKQTNCFYQDWLYDFCAENGVYVMLALQHHGPVSTQVNPNWNNSPYNVANGGPCQNTIDFFTNDEARAHTKNRYRYIVARWGYSRAILCWELFNEVHWTDNFQANKALVADWHFEMAGYLKSIDPNQHIVTTSYGGDLDDENVWGHPDIDLTQTHIYFNTPNIEKVLANASRNHLTAFEKPTLNGEFGLGGSASLANEDPDGIHLHNSLWGGLFSGSLGTAMTWWWDNYIHPQDLYYHFGGLSQVVEVVPFLDKNMSPAKAYVTGAPGNLQLTPSLDWGGIGEDGITIDENGLVTPAGAALGVFLYGSQWNTQYRSPPTFHVDYLMEGSFIVRTGDEVATTPKIAIYLDGNLQLEQPAQPNTSYEITVPAGMHNIKVDNTGTDWTKIAFYAFEGLGSQVDAYTLVSQDKTMAAGWALNNIYNHQNVVANGEPDPAPPTNVLVEGFQDGNYSVRWYSPMTGALYGGNEAIANGGVLNIPLPSLLWDLAFIVDDSPVATEDTFSDLPFSVYPNPAKAGQTVQLAFPTLDQFLDKITLLDATGRAVMRLDGYSKSENVRQIHLPENISAGLYWLKIERNGKVGARAMKIGR